jgi:hypothetical protein
MISAYDDTKLATQFIIANWGCVKFQKEQLGEVISFDARKPRWKEIGDREVQALQAHERPEA